MDRSDLLTQSVMDSGHLIFDSSSSRPAHMLILGGSGSPIFRGARSMLSMEDGTNKRPRPFFTSPEELLEEEYYDEQLPEKKRRLTPEQVHLLERSFEAENKLEPERKSELAKKLGLQPRQVAVWFQNRRARWKTKQLEQDFDRLKAAYDSLLADHDSLLEDNDRLRSQVATLTEKLETKELAIVGPTAELAADKNPSLHVNVYAKGTEDHLSTGSGGSAVLEGDGPQLVDSSDESYFHQDSFHGDCVVGAINGGGVHSAAEEDDGSDDGCNYEVFGGNHHATDALWEFGTEGLHACNL